MCDLVGVHLLVVYLNSTHVQPGSRNVLAVVMDLLGLHLLVAYLNSTHVQLGSGDILAVAISRFYY